MRTIKFSESPRAGITYENRGTDEDAVMHPADEVVAPPPPTQIGQVGVNPVFKHIRGPSGYLEAVEPEVRLDHILGLSFENRHLRDDGLPPETGDSEVDQANTQAWRAEIERQAYLLSRVPSDIDVIVGSDGAGSDSWPEVTYGVLGQLAAGVGYEGFSYLCSPKIKEGMVVHTPSDMDEQVPTVRSRGEAHGLGLPLVRGFTPSMGPLNTTNVTPKAMIEWLAGLSYKNKGEEFVNLTRWFLWDGWTALYGSGKQALSPYKRDANGQWLLREFDPVFWDRLRDALDEARKHAFKITLTFLDRAGTSPKHKEGRWQSHIWNAANSDIGLVWEDDTYPYSLLDVEGRFWDEVTVPLALEVRKFLIEYHEVLMVEIINEANPEQAQSNEQLVTYHDRVARVLLEGV